MITDLLTLQKLNSTLKENVSTLEKLEAEKRAGAEQLARLREQLAAETTLRLNADGAFESMAHRNAELERQADQQAAQLHKWQQEARQAADRTGEFQDKASRLQDTVSELRNDILELNVSGRGQYRGKVGFERRVRLTVVGYEDCQVQTKGELELTTNVC